MSRSLLLRASVAVVVLATLACAASGRAVAAPPEPSGPHPRLFLDPPTLKALKALAKDKKSLVAQAVTTCKEIGDNLKEKARDYYMGLDWGTYLQNCLIAYKATDDKKAAATALVYFKALLSDLDNVGDGKGGNNAVRRDSGYAMRAMGPNTALAYDWLYDAPGVDEELRELARERFKAWTDWYEESGYMNRTPAANYHAGYMFGATLIAIAQGSEAGGDGGRLWRHVWGTIYAKDMANAMDGGVLDGGDWGEGWQYAPLSVAEYALAARAMASHGLDTEPYAKWLSSLFVRHVYALTPGTEEVFVGGDTDEEVANLKPNALTLNAVIAGPSSAEAKGWARAELERLGLAGKSQFPIFGALAETEVASDKAFPRSEAPTWYIARGTGTLYSRTTWAPSAVWFVSQCVSHMKVDHSHPNAGNFVLTRGDDDVIVDPSPYGSLSSLTSNAPTVENAQFPDHYRPSQSFWGVQTRFHWSRQTASGVIAARCDYADQYKFQERPSDVPAAKRDLVVVPYGKGGDAMTVIIDRARSGDAKRGLHLRFRTPARLTLSKDVAHGTSGDTAVTIRRLATTGGTAEIGSMERSSCFKDGITRGGCAEARFAVNEYKLVVPGPEMEAIHVIDASPKKGGEPASALVEGKGWKAVTAVRGDRTIAIVTAAVGKTASLSYALPAAAGGVHIVVDGPASEGGRATVTAVKQGSDCAVTLAPAKDGGFDAGPLVFAIDDACAVAEDPTLTTPLAFGGDPGPKVDGGAAVGSGSGDGTGSAAPGSGSGDGTGTGAGGGTSVTPGGTRPAAGQGCCGAQNSTAPVGMSLFVAFGLFLVLRRRDS